jgi:excisionase family DNA binding protein
MPTSTSTPQTKLVYTRDEVAEILGVHPMTILRMTKRGALRQCRGLRRSRYSHEELQRYLRDNTRGEVTTKFKS